MYLEENELACEEIFKTAINSTTIRNTLQNSTILPTLTDEWNIHIMNKPY
jgi:hypothetical protein